MLQLKPQKVPVLCKKSIDANEGFTHEDLQFMLALNKQNIAEFDREIKACKWTAARLWEDCDRTDPDTLGSYETFLHYLNRLEGLKAKKKRLESIQRKIKVQLRT